MILQVDIGTVWVTTLGRLKLFGGKEAGLALKVLRSTSVLTLLHKLQMLRHLAALQ